jgi:hypothetical protein
MILLPLIWVHRRPWRTILAPILISFSLNVVSDHCSMASGIHRDIAFALADEVDD